MTLYQRADFTKNELPDDIFDPENITKRLGNIGLILSRFLLLLCFTMEQESFDR